MEKTTKSKSEEKTKDIQKDYSLFMKGAKPSTNFSQDILKGRFEKFSLYDNSKYENHTTCNLKFKLS